MNDPEPNATETSAGTLVSDHEDVTCLHNADFKDGTIFNPSVESTFLTSSNSRDSLINAMAFGIGPRSPSCISRFALIELILSSEW
jgi:hypothetical protein